MSDEKIPHTISKSTALENDYRVVQSQLDAALEGTLRSDAATRLSEIWQKTSDIEVWMEVVGGRNEASILEDALRQLHDGLQSVAFGLYRSSFISLRYFLEQGIRAVWLSGHEVQLRHWLNGSQDVVWGTIVNNTDSGVFSTAFVEAFFPDLKNEAKHMHTLAAKVYRELSEIIHGNTNPFVALPRNIVLEKEVLSSWLTTADSVIFVMSFALFVRYGKEATIDQLRELESPIMDQLQHLEPVRYLYDQLHIEGVKDV